jgi:hypothetical protein
MTAAQPSGDRLPLRDAHTRETLSSDQYRLDRLSVRCKFCGQPIVEISSGDWEPVPVVRKYRSRESRRKRVFMMQPTKD